VLLDVPMVLLQPTGELLHAVCGAGVILEWMSWTSGEASFDLISSVLQAF
jgi:hypothetical protein